MIHLLPVTFWITGLRCTCATPRGRAYLLVLSRFGLNIYSLLRSTCLNAWRKQNIYCLSLPRCSQLSPSPIPSFTSHGRLCLLAGDAQFFPVSLCCRVCLISSRQKMDSDSDSPFNYSWPSFPKMKIRRRASKQGSSWDLLPLLEPRQASSSSYLSFPHCFAELFLMECMFIRVFVNLTHRLYSRPWSKPTHSSCVPFTWNLLLVLYYAYAIVQKINRELSTR